MNTQPPTREEVINSTAEFSKFENWMNGELVTDSEITKTDEDPNELNIIIKRITCEDGWKIRGLIETFIDNKKKYCAIETEAKPNGSDSEFYKQARNFFEGLSDMFQQISDPEYREKVRAFLDLYYGQKEGA